MRPEDSDPARVWDMVHWGRRLARMIEGVTWVAYREDEVLQVAVERCIEVIGEAARHLSDDFKARHPDIPLARHRAAAKCHRSRLFFP